MTKPKNVDEYIASAPKEAQSKLREMRAVIHSAAPKAEEGISYGIPAYNLGGVLVYFAGYSSHIGFYPTSSGIREFKKELSVFKTSKGTVRFPLDKPLPFELITKIVRFRVKENLKNE
jgi:uncharacterized protein YdhG (YjbR/CyaY superfamily)